MKLTYNHDKKVALPRVNLKNERNERNETPLKCLANEDSFNCSECVKVFTKERNMIRHWKVFHSSNFSCNLCDNDFKAYDKLNAHLKGLHHGMVTKKKLKKKDTSSLVCDDCNKTFEKRREMSAHCRHVHSTNKLEKYKCEKCPKSFYKLEFLDRHLEMHRRKEDCYQCEECGIQSISLKKHNKHLLSHSDFICIPCNKRPFRNKVLFCVSIFT